MKRLAVRAAILMLGIMSLTAWADPEGTKTVVMKSGQFLHGKIVKSDKPDEKNIVLEVDVGKIAIPKDKILRIDEDTPEVLAALEARSPKKADSDDEDEDQPKAKKADKKKDKADKDKKKLDDTKKKQDELQKLAEQAAQAQQNNRLTDQYNPADDWNSRHAHRGSTVTNFYNGYNQGGSNNNSGINNNNANSNWNTINSQFTNPMNNNNNNNNKGN